MNLRGGLVESEEIIELEKEDDDPVNACDDAVLGKGGWGILAPDGVLPVDMVIVFAVAGFRWSMKVVIDRCDQKEDVGEGSGDLVDEDGLTRVSVSAGEWVETVTT